MTRRERPVVYPDPVPDRLTRVVRAVCGLLLGTGLGGVLWLRGGFGLLPGLLVLAGSIVCCTIGAVRGGDAFWMRVLRRGG